VSWRTQQRMVPRQNAYAMDSNHASGRADLEEAAEWRWHTQQNTMPLNCHADAKWNILEGEVRKLLIPIMG
jgi:hypothetical protein